MTIDLGTTTLAVGALGAASYGIVDGLKFFPWIDLSGFENLFSCTIGGRWWPKKPKADLDQLYPALKLVYGDNVMDVLKVQYRAGRATGVLKDTLKRDVHNGFGMMKHDEIITTMLGLGITLNTARLFAEGLEQERNLLPPIAGEKSAVSPSPSTNNEAGAAFECLRTTIDARVDAALLLANSQFATQTRLYAMAISLAIAVAVGFFSLKQSLGMCFLVGIAAVPLAPVGKDLSTALQEAAKALSKR